LYRTDVRAEDVLTGAAAITLVLLIGTKALRTIQLTEANFWDMSFILLPVALLVFSAAVRYAFRPVGGMAIAEVSAATGHILRDWSPFLIFLMLYESFRLNTWSLVSPVDKDALLLRTDLTLFGVTPSVPLDRWISPAMTQVMVIAYFLHLILPPLIGLVWYRRDITVFRQFLLSVLVAAMIGGIGYALVPAIGPGVAFPSLYRHALTGSVYENITSLLNTARAPRDAFPSLHVGISSLVLWFAWRRGRAAFAVILPLVAANWLSTLYLRYHYLIDIFAGWAVAIAAIVLSAAILRLEQRIRERVNPPAAAA
jgi:membrane-associated phospholipid phosphatase